MLQEEITYTYKEACSLVRALVFEYLGGDTISEQDLAHYCKEKGYSKSSMYVIFSSAMSDKEEEDLKKYPSLVKAVISDFLDTEVTTVKRVYFKFKKNITL